MREVFNSRVMIANLVPFVNSLPNFCVVMVLPHEYELAVKLRWPTGDTAFTKRKHCKQKRNCKNVYAHYKQNNFTLQKKLQHAANKTPVRCKKNYTLQTKLPHTANKTPARCKQKNYTLQTKLQHAANKKITRCKQTPARCKQNSSTLQTKAKVLRAQDDVKDWDLV